MHARLRVDRGLSGILASGLCRLSRGIEEESEVREPRDESWLALVGCGFAACATLVFWAMFVWITVSVVHWTL